MPDNSDAEDRRAFAYYLYIYGRVSHSAPSDKEIENSATLECNSGNGRESRINARGSYANRHAGRPAWR